MIDDFMVKLFGKSWRTAFWGLISGIIAFVQYSPDILAPLPDYWEDLVKKFVAFGIAIGLFKLGLSSRDNKASEEAVKSLKSEINKKEDKQHTNYEKF